MSEEQQSAMKSMEYGSPVSPASMSVLRIDKAPTPGLLSDNAPHFYWPFILLLAAIMYLLGLAWYDC